MKQALQKITILTKQAHKNMAQKSLDIEIGNKFNFELKELSSTYIFVTVLQI